MTRQALKTLDRFPPDRRDTLRRRYAAEIMAVSDHFKIRPHTLWGEERKKPFTKARCALARELRNRGTSLDVIGAVLGRDHTSVGYYLGGKPYRGRNS